MARLPLAAAFPFTIGRPLASVAILIAAGFSDVLDGWYARRTGQATTAGAVLDPVVDKLFVATVVVTLLLADRLSLQSALLIGARDILELPLAAGMVLQPSRWAVRAAQVRPNPFGKAATVLQFATLGAALISPSNVHILAVTPAMAGVIAAASYWSRVLRPNEPPRAWLPVILGRRSK